MISGTQTSISYTSNGVATTYAIPYYFWEFDDLLVQIVVNGIVSNLALNTAYLITGTPDAYGAYPNGGNVVFQPGQIPAAGTTIVISRKTDPTQLDTYPDNNPFPATVTEHDFDKLTLIVQELGATGFLGVLPGPPPNPVVGNWFIVQPFQPGGVWGYAFCNDNNWHPFAMISL